MHIKFWLEDLRGSKPLGRLTHRWENNIKVHLKEIGWEGVGWIHLAQDRYQWRTLLNTAVNLWVP
jgi:hypothetical protein